MPRQLTPQEIAERSLIKTYRKSIWNPFIAAVKRYELVEPGDRIAVCISGGKDSMVLAKLMQELQRHTERPFDLTFLVMDPGYNPANRALIEENAARLGIPITIFESDIFDVTVQVEKNPCYLCARMRRGALHDVAKELGCNKVALGHHGDDAVETFVMNLFNEGRIGCFSPVTYMSRKDLHVIRPLIYARERDVLHAVRTNDLPVVKSVCPVDEKTNRQWTKEWLLEMEKTHPGITMRLYGAMQRGHVSGW